MWTGSVPLDIGNQVCRPWLSVQGVYLSLYPAVLARAHEGLRLPPGRRLEGGNLGEGQVARLPDRPRARLQVVSQAGKGVLTDDRDLAALGAGGGELADVFGPAAVAVIEAQESTARSSTAPHSIATRDREIASHLAFALRDSRSPFVRDRQ